MSELNVKVFTHMHIYCTHLLLLGILLLAHYVELYAQALHLEHISVEQGLSNSVITHIHQDKYGYMWFATQHGLNRFDGFDFQVYRYDPTDSLSITTNLIYHIYEDQMGNLWLSLGIGGLCKFDRDRESFSYFAYDKNYPLHLNNKIIVSSKGSWKFLVIVFMEHSLFLEAI